MILQAQTEAAKEALFAANIGVGGDLSNLLSEDNPDGVVMITEEGKITFVNKVLLNAGHTDSCYESVCVCLSVCLSVHICACWYIS